MFALFSTAELAAVTAFVILVGGVAFSTYVALFGIKSSRKAL